MRERERERRRYVDRSGAIDCRAAGAANLSAFSARILFRVAPWIHGISKEVCLEVASNEGEAALVEAPFKSAPRFAKPRDYAMRIDVPFNQRTIV